MKFYSKLLYMFMVACLCSVILNTSILVNDMSAKPNVAKIIIKKSNQSLNLMAGWDGNGATGGGSSPDNFGWIADQEVTFTYANGSINSQYSSFMYRDFEEERGVVSGLGNTFMFPVNLEKGKSYECYASFSYFDGSVTGNVPFFILDTQGVKVAETEVVSVTHVNTAYRGATIAFTAPENGKYYVSYKNPISGKRLFVKKFKLEEVVNLNLSSLTVNTGQLTPAFDSDITNYTLLVPPHWSSPLLIGLFNFQSCKYSQSCLPLQCKEQSTAIFYTVSCLDDSAPNIFSSINL